MQGDLHVYLVRPGALDDLLSNLCREQSATALYITPVFGTATTETSPFRILETDPHEERKNRLQYQAHWLLADCGPRRQVHWQERYWGVTNHAGDSDKVPIY